MSPITGAGTSVRYSERLWPSFPWWFVTAALSAMTAAMVYPVWRLGAFLVPVAIFLIAAAWLRSLSAAIIVTDQEFVAGAAHIDRSFVTGAVPYNQRESFVARGAGLDARAFLMTRPWVKTVVKVTIDDPADPTPYWLVSARHPRELVAALSRR